jgi:LDH2 family malate/lactate/ureidoglycolate dehydrogenase
MQKNAETPNQSSCESIRIPVPAASAFALEVFSQLRVPHNIAALAVRSLMDASLLGVDSHGIEALEMYVPHIREGGLRVNAPPKVISQKGCLHLWDLQHGFGMASARMVMRQTIVAARKHGMCVATCRNGNHIGACGVYGKMAADEGLIGMASQQTLACFPPFGGAEARIGASPLAVVAPVSGAFPFYYDASMAVMTRATIKEYLKSGRRLPEGVALDESGNPTTDPGEAWKGQIVAIGKHKGIGLAMAIEILQCVLSGNQFSLFIPSIVDNPEQSADTSLFLAAIDPEAVAEPGAFAKRMREYTDYCESSRPRDDQEIPRYPGRREGEIWAERTKLGIPIPTEVLDQFDRIADSLNAPRLARGTF